MDTIKFQQRPAAFESDLSLLNGVGNEVLAFHQNFLITGSRRCVAGILSQPGAGIDPYKDEAQRFGLNAFKGLGGSYAMEISRRSA
ncbi:Diaminopropionate ammonia-lyase [Klebsiella pneumoniae]|nr:Diaminopropionate ammonia-lyase [Klebsiella pneumoniae]